MPSAFLRYGEHCLTQHSLFSSDLVNGLVALMNSNVSSPVNLVSTVLPLPCSSWSVFGEGLSWPTTSLCRAFAKYSSETKQSKRLKSNTLEACTSSIVNSLCLKGSVYRSHLESG